jgi:hypothetical protein
MSKKCPTTFPKYCGEWKSTYGNGKAAPCIERGTVNGVGPDGAGPCFNNKDVFLLRNSRHTGQSVGYKTKKCGKGDRFTGESCDDVSKGSSNKDSSSSAALSWFGSSKTAKTPAKKVRQKVEPASSWFGSSKKTANTPANQVRQKVEPASSWFGSSKKTANTPANQVRPPQANQVRPPQANQVRPSRQNTNERAREAIFGFAGNLANGLAEFTWKGMKFIGTFVKGQTDSGSGTRSGFVWLYETTKTSGRWVLVKGGELGTLSREGYSYSKEMYNAYRDNQMKNKLSTKSKQLWKSAIMKQMNKNKAKNNWKKIANNLKKKSTSLYYSPNSSLSSYYTPTSSLTQKSASPRKKKSSPRGNNAGYESE